MRILFSLLDADTGGGQRVAADVAAELAQRGHELGVVVTADGRALDAFRSLDAATHFVDLTNLRRPLAVQQAAALLADYDVLYSHTSVPGEILGAAAAARARRPHVIHRHIYPHLSSQRLVRAAQATFYRRALRSARLVICVAQHVADDVRALGAPAARVRVVPNGVRIPDAAPPRTGEPVRIGLLGRIDPQKGIDVLLDAAPLVRAGRELELVVAGPVGPFADYAADMRRLAASRGVELREGSTNPDEFLSSVDIVAMPSRYEGAPLVLLEAMALGRAVVASAIPGVIEVLDGTDAGVLVPPGDPPALAAALGSLADDPHRRTQVGGNARELVQREYAIERVAPRIADLIDGAETPSPARVAIVTEIPAPFRIPLFNTLAQGEGVELRVVFLSDHDPRRHYAVYEDEMSFDRETLPGTSVTRGGRWLVLNRGVRRSLEAFQPDVVIAGGWNQPAFWQAARYARRRETPLLVWVESTRADARLDHGAAARVRDAFVRRAAGFVVPGSASREYVRSLGVADAAIFVAPNAVDLEIFSVAVEGAHRDREATRLELGLAGVVVLYVGRFAREKGLDTLIAAARGASWNAVLLGEGPQREELEQTAPGNVIVGSYTPREALVPWFAAADIFVLPSLSEPWGMVLNEAVAAGLPIVATDHVGAAPDLVDGNGAIVPAGDVAALRAALDRLAEDHELRARARERSLELSKRFSPTAWARGIEHAVVSVRARG